MAEEDFDFGIDEEEPKPKPVKKVRKKKDPIAGDGIPASVIAEARQLAGSRKGLDVDKFVKKHKLVYINIERLLNAPLNKDGTYA